MKTNYRTIKRLIIALDPDPRLLAETLVTLSNSGGGTILIGVDETGQAKEQVYEDEGEESLTDATREILQPFPIQLKLFEFEEIE